MAETCSQCGGCEFDTEDTSLEKICTGCGVVAVGNSSNLILNVNEVHGFGIGNNDVSAASHDEHFHLKPYLPPNYLRNADIETLDTTPFDAKESGQNVGEEILQGTSSFSQTCKQCGGSEFDTGDLSNSCQKVCVNCGLVDDRATNITSDDGLANQGIVSLKTDYHCRENLPSHYSHHSDVKKLSRGANSAVKKFYMLSRRLNLPDHVHQFGEGVLNRALEIKELKHQHDDSKIKLGVSCVYLACRHFDLPFNASEAANSIEGCAKHEIFQYFNFICSKLDINVKHLTFNEWVEMETKKFNLPLDKKLLDNIQKLADLLVDFWVTDGRNPRAVIAAMIYIVLLASAKPKMNLKEFLKTHGYDCDLRSCQQRFSEICDVLGALANKIPWLTETKMKKTKVLDHLDDILAYRKSLQFDVCRDKRRTEVPLTTVSNNTILPSSNEKNLQASDTRESCQSDGPKGIAGHALVEKKRKTEWIGKHPPCFKPDNGATAESIAKKRKLEAAIKFARSLDLDKPELDDKDIGDSELKSYLRSDDEVKIYKQLVNKHM